MLRQLLSFAASVADRNVYGTRCALAVERGVAPIFHNDGRVYQRAAPQTVLIALAAVMRCPKQLHTFVCPTANVVVMLSFGNENRVHGRAPHTTSKQLPDIRRRESVFGPIDAAVSIWGCRATIIADAEQRFGTTTESNAPGLPRAVRKAIALAEAAGKVWARVIAVTIGVVIKRGDA